jgi:hypothetical protein
MPKSRDKILSPFCFGSESSKPTFTRIIDRDNKKDKASSN